MAALITVSPSSPVANSTTTATASGGLDDKNRLLLDGSLIGTICRDTGFTFGVLAGEVGSHTLDWEQHIAGVWTAADSVSFTTVAAPTPSGSGPIVITSSNTTIEDLTFSATTSNGPQGTRTIFISTSGSSAASPFTNIIIRRCRFSGGTIAIWLKWCNSVTIEDCVVEDADYAGIDVWSCITGTIQRNTVRRIGYSRTDFTDGAFLNNAYGIILNRNESASLVTDPVCDGFTVDSNTVDWVPIWMGINTHGGKNTTFSNNTVSHCPRGIFVAGSPTGAGTTQCQNLTIDSNNIYTPVTKAGGSSDLEGILYASVATISITDNGIDYDAVDPVGGGTIGSPGYFDYGNASTGETISGNHLI
jgi:parallel beta-helix repeat protein